MSAMTNGLGGGIDQVRTKAIVDALKEHVDRKMMSIPTGAVTNLHKTEVQFPTDQLAKVLAVELAKAVQAIAWPQPSVEVKAMPSQAVVKVEGEAIAKALGEVGRMMSEAPLPIMEAVDLEPLVREIREGNEAVVDAIERFTQATLVQGEMLKGLAQAIVNQSKAATKQGPTTLTVNHSDGTTSTIVKD